MSSKFHIPAVAVLLVLLAFLLANRSHYDFFEYQDRISHHTQFKSAFREYILIQRRKEKSVNPKQKKINSYALGARMTEIFSAIQLKDPEASLEVLHALQRLMPQKMEKGYRATLKKLKQDVATNQWRAVDKNLDLLYKNLSTSENVDKIKFNFGHWLAQINIAQQEKEDLRYHLSASRYFSRKLSKTDLPSGLLNNLENMQSVLADYPVNNEHLAGNLRILGKLTNI